MKQAFADFAGFIVKRRVWVVLLVVMATVFLASRARTLELIIDPNNLLPQSHPYVSTTNFVEKVFGSKYVVLIGIQPKTGDVYQPLVLDKVAQITQRLNETPGVIRTNLLSLTAKRAKDIKGVNDSLEVTQIGKPGQDAAATAQGIKAALARNPIYQTILVSPDQRMTAIVVEMKERPGGYRAMMEPIQRIVAEAGDPQITTFVGGNPVFLAASEKFSARMAFLFPIAILIVGLIHYEAFRTFQGLFLPLTTAILAVVWGLGFMGLFRVPLDVFNTPTPILILAVAAGHAVQLLKRYYEDYNRLASIPGAIPRDAARRAVIESVSNVGPVMVTAGVVAALGFLSLLVFEISTIRTFGLFTGIGILSALLLEMTLIPAVRAMLPPPSEKERRLERKYRVWDAIPGAIARWVTGPRRKYVWPGVALLCVIAVAGIAQIRVDNANKSFFSSSLPFQKDDEALNASLAGTNTLYVVVRGEPDSIKDPEVLRGMDSIQTMLARQPNVGKTVSIVDFVKRINQAMHGEDPAYHTIPDSRELISQYLFLYSMSGEPGDFDSYVDYQYQNASLVVFLKSGSTAGANQLIAKIGEIAPGAFGTKAKVSIGGSVPQAAALTQVMVEGKVQNIVQIGGVIFLISAVLFRSLLAGLLVMLPLALAVLVNFGLMGWTGIPLNIPNSLSSAMAVGIGADYAIYLIYRLREEYGKTKDLNKAVENALASAGKASLFVASAVAGGYGVLLFSIGFNVHFWLAILIGTAMFVSVFAALILIPGVILAFRPRFAFGYPFPAPAAGVTTGIAILALCVAAAPRDAAAADLGASAIMERNFMVAKVIDSLGATTIQLTHSGGQQRIRKTHDATKLTANGYDNMRVTRFTEPADVKGTGVLLIEHADGDDDMWIWLPAMKKVRRLVASNKRDGFLGTDFTYGDVLGHRVQDWSHRLVHEDDVEGQATYVIESTPKTPVTRSNTGYSKRMTWIRKDNFVTVKGEFWDEAGEPLKRMRATQIRQVDPANNKWQAMFLEAVNIQTGHRTTVRIDSIRVNQKVSDELFTTRYLERE